MTVPRIPLNRPALVGREIDYVSEACTSKHLAGDGSFTRRCHELLETRLGVAKALLTTSGTHALELGALLLDVGPEDEVILPAFTFVSTVNAFMLRGARVVFSDVRPDTLNLDEARLESLLSPRTKVIVPVHYAGVGCEMSRIVQIARNHGAAVFEDNAHGLFGKYEDSYLGTFGVLAAQSFHETKNLQCGEGGALLVNDPELKDRAEILREKGTNRTAFLRGHVHKYDWLDVGSSYLPSELVAAFLLAQLEAAAEVENKRRRIWERYYEGLRGWAGEAGVGLPFVPQQCRHPYHLFYLLTPSQQDREGLREHLAERGIASAFHYLPLHLSPMGRRLGGQEGDCPVAEDVSRRLLRLPFYTDLSEEDQSKVISAVCSFTPETAPAPSVVGQALSAGASGGRARLPETTDS